MNTNAEINGGGAAQSPVAEAIGEAKIGDETAISAERQIAEVIGELKLDELAISDLTPSALTHRTHAPAR